MKNFRSQWLVLVAFAAFLFLPSSPLLAQDYYVLAGKDGKGTKKAPFGMIQDALDVASPGDVIHIAQGFYMGEGGVGKWIIRKPQLSLVGGYKKDFSHRDPFTYQTVLIRGLNSFGALRLCKKRKHEKSHPMTPTKAGYNVGPMILGSSGAYESHDQTILDGLVIDGHTRNLYRKNSSLRLDKGAIGSPLVNLTGQGCKVRNSILLNSAGPGIRMASKGESGRPDTYNEVSNCLIINTLMSGIECQIGEGLAVIKNNTISFVWEHLNLAYGLTLGSGNRVLIEGNIFALARWTGVSNLRTNRNCALKNNIFWANQEGHYKYFSPRTRSYQIVDKVAKLKGEKAQRRYCLAKASGGNVVANPGLGWNKALKEKFLKSNKKGSQYYAPPLDLKDTLVFPSKDAKGAQKKKSYLKYSSPEDKKEAQKYKKIEYGEIKGKLLKPIQKAGKKGIAVEFTCQIKNFGSTGFYHPKVSQDTHHAFMTRQQLVYLYVPKGSSALRKILQAKKEGDKIVIRGVIFDISPWSKVSRSMGMIVNEVEIPSDF